MAAGWTQADLDWEALAEEVASSVAANDAEAASGAAGKALGLARESFTQADPRLASAMANQAMCAARRDRDVGGKLLDEARLAWNGTHTWIEAMQAPRVARSSLFHMRMEQRHRASYESNWRIKWRDIADGAKGRIGAARLDGAWDGPAAEAALERWRRERPAMLNDTRKLLAAAYLLLPGVAGG